MVTRPGRSSFGCLVMLLLVAAALYFGVNFGEAYWRFYEYQDAMRQEVRFAAQISDDRMRMHLTSLADSLGLPDEASDVTISRSGRQISVGAEYSERVEVPFFARDIRFRPRARGTF